MENPRPTFLCIGVQKAGTSWLYRMLRQHPEVGTGDPKEIHFFNREKNYQQGWQWYVKHFSHCRGAKAIGEFTPDYLSDKTQHPGVPGHEVASDIPARVAEALPDLRLLVVLRNPVDRAVSSYFHEIGAGRLSPNVRLGLAADRAGILSKGYYAQHLQAWFLHYPRDRFKILIYEEDLSQQRRAETLQQVFAHIGVDNEFAPADRDHRYNKRRSHFDYRLSRLDGGVQKFFRRNAPRWIKDSSFWNIPVAKAELEMLRDLYEPRNRALEHLLGRTLPW